MPYGRQSVKIRISALPRQVSLACASEMGCVLGGSASGTKMCLPSIIPHFSRDGAGGSGGFSDWAGLHAGAICRGAGRGRSGEADWVLCGLADPLGASQVSGQGAD